LGEDLGGLFFRDDDGHADAHVEDLIHLGFGDFAAFLDEAEEFGDLPGIFADGGAAGFGKDAGEIVEEATAGNVGGSVETAGRQGAHEGLVIRVDAEEFAAEGELHAWRRFVQGQAHFFEEHLAGERVAVGMEAVAAEADDGVTGADFRAVEEFRTVHDADDGPGDIVFAFLIHAGHLGGFTTDQGAASFLAGFGEAFEDLLEDDGIEFFTADIVQEKQGPGADDGDVIDAMVDEILADRVVAVRGEGDFEFRADSVHAGDEHGVFHAAQVRAEEAAEAADFAQNLGSMGGADEGVDSFFDLVAEVHIDSGSGVGFFGLFQNNRLVGSSRRRALPWRCSMMSLSNLSS